MKVLDSPTYQIIAWLIVQKMCYAVNEIVSFRFLHEYTWMSLNLVVLIKSYLLPKKYRPTLLYTHYALNHDSLQTWFILMAFLYFLFTENHVDIKRSGPRAMLGQRKIRGNILYIYCNSNKQCIELNFS